MKSKLRSFSLSKLMVISSVAFLMSRCGPQETVEPNFTSLDSNFFEGCGTCHNPDSQTFATEVALAMNTSKNERYASLTSAAIVYSRVPDCNGLKIVSPGDYANSVIKAIAGDSTERAEFAAAHPGCEPTHFNDKGYPISNEVKEAIRTWVNAGGAND